MMGDPLESFARVSSQKQNREGVVCIKFLIVLIMNLCVLFWTNYYVYFICTNSACQVKEKKGRSYDKPTWGKSDKPLFMHLFLA